MLFLVPVGTPMLVRLSNSINRRVHEHLANIKHGRTRSSALARHAEKTKHHICSEEARVIGKIAPFHHWKFREAIEVEKRPSNLNRDDYWKISNC